MNAGDHLTAGDRLTIIDLVHILRARGGCIACLCGPVYNIAAFASWPGQVIHENRGQAEHFKYFDPKHGGSVQVYSRATLVDIASSFTAVFNTLVEAGYSTESTYALIRLEITGFKKQQGSLFSQDELVIFKGRSVLKENIEVHVLKWKDVKRIQIDNNMLIIDNLEVLPLFDLVRLSSVSRSLIEVSNSLKSWEDLLEASGLSEECKDYEDAQKAQLLYVNAINEICAYLAAL